MTDMFKILQIEFDRDAERVYVSPDFLNAGHGTKAETQEISYRSIAPDWHVKIRDKWPAG